MNFYNYYMEVANHRNIPKREKTIHQYSKDDIVDNTFALKFTKPPIPTKNGSGSDYFTCQVSDSTGEMPARFWGHDNSVTKQIYDSIHDSKVVYVQGIIQEWNDTLYISINGKTGVIESTNDFNPGDFVKVSKTNIDEMIADLDEKIEGIENSYLRKLLQKYFDNPNNMKLYSTCPAAMSYHQNYIGGLLEHSLRVTEICWFSAVKDLELDSDLLVAGCLLHDIGKIYELEVSTGINVTEEGNFLGHVTSGVILVNDMIREIPDFPEILRLKLLHIIISHHGKKEHGALKEPSFPEAELIHQADMMDSQVSYMQQQIEQSNTDDDWLWDGKTKRRIFRH